MIFACIFNMELLIECSLFAEDELENKIYIIADGCLGPVLIPILYVLILGMCTDRIRDAELQLQQLIVITQSLYMRKIKLSLLTVMVLDNEVRSFLNCLISVTHGLFSAYFFDALPEIGTTPEHDHFGYHLRS